MTPRTYLEEAQPFSSCPWADASGQDRIRDLVLQAYAEHEQTAAAAE